ncbi:MAG: diguanylate cyclase [Lachnospiraceae bacterium]|nr:diguanylate cyclase [Lachnospiraceae bacterium]
MTREVLECKLNELVQPVVVSDKDLGHTEKFTLSAGYVMIESNEESLNELYQKADKAMFDAKKNGKSNFAEYQQE